MPLRRAAASARHAAIDYTAFRDTAAIMRDGCAILNTQRHMLRWPMPLRPWRALDLPAYAVARRYAMISAQRCATAAACAGRRAQPPPRLMAGRASATPRFICRLPCRRCHAPPMFAATADAPAPSIDAYFRIAMPPRF